MAAFIEARSTEVKFPADLYAAVDAEAKVVGMATSTFIRAVTIGALVRGRSNELVTAAETNSGLDGQWFKRRAEPDRSHLWERVAPLQYRRKGPGTGPYQLRRLNHGGHGEDRSDLDNNGWVLFFKDSRLGHCGWTQRDAIRAAEKIIADRSASRRTR